MATTSKQNELQVSLIDFNTVLKNSRYGAKLGKRNIANEVVVLSFDGVSLMIEIIGVIHKIPATGNWPGSALIPLRTFGLLRQAPPVQNPLILSYVEPKMRIGDTNFSVKWE